jgi:sugar phosphate isomerase/epimerase
MGEKETKMKLSNGGKRGLMLNAILVMMIVLINGSAFSAEKRFTLKQYPNIKVGFTTANFSKYLPVSMENSKKLIDFAGVEGFGWIEIRDPNATLTLNECQQISEYAKEKKIEVAYSIQIGLLDSNFSEVFSRGLPNAAAFEGPRTIRSLACGDEIRKDPNKKAWNSTELEKLVQTANQAANQAKTMGVTFVLENALEPIKGDGTTSFGISEFFAKVNPNVGFQFDTANPFCTSRVLAKPEDAQSILEKYINRMPYLHLKSSSKEHKPLPVLAENELDFKIILDLMSKHKVTYAAFELTPGKTLEETYDNHKKSLEYLKKQY